MSYYFATPLTCPFEEALEKAREALKEEGFGIITEIDIQATLKQKIGVDFRPYVILGACNPMLAHEALQLEDKVGTMLPCNVVVQQAGDRVEVAAINPVASMQAIENDRLLEKAGIVASKLRRVIGSLGGAGATEEARAAEHRAEIEREAQETGRALESVPPPGSDPLHEGP